jgi:hypothetical protein
MRWGGRWARRRAGRGCPRGSTRARAWCAPRPRQASGLFAGLAGPRPPRRRARAPADHHPAHPTTAAANRPIQRPPTNHRSSQPTNPTRVQFGDFKGKGKMDFHFDDYKGKCKGKVTSAHLFTGHVSYAPAVWGAECLSWSIVTRACAPRQTRERLQVGPEVGPTSAFYSCIPT